MLFLCRSRSETLSLQLLTGSCRDVSHHVSGYGKRCRRVEVCPFSEVHMEQNWVSINPG